MPRARNIKPSLFMNEILGEADPLLTILFMSLWCLADREGRLEDRPLRIKVETFPYRNDNEVDIMLYELQRMGFIKRYKEQDFELIQVINFLKHQKPHHTEKASILPACSDKSLIRKGDKILTVKTPLEHGEIPVVKRSDSLIPDLLIPDSRFLITEKAPTRKITADADFEKFWNLYPKRPGANKTQAQKAWDARLNTDVAIEDMLRGADRYRRYCETMNVEPQYIKQAATFLGPDKHFMNDWTAKRNGSQDFVNRLTGRGGDDDVIDI